jgi:hypothetical protein
MTRCTALRLFSQGDRGSCTFYQYRLGSFGPRTLAWNGEQRVRGGNYGPTGATTSQIGGFERLRLRPHSEPTCSLGTRRDTSRRCGGLAPVPSASVLLHVDARVNNPST